MVRRHTVQEVALQVLAQAHMGRAQGVVQLVEPAAVVPVTEIAHDSGHQLLDVSQSVVQCVELVLCDEGLEEFCMARISLCGLVLHFLDDGAACFVAKLEATTEVDDLGGEACHRDIRSWSHWWIVELGLRRSLVLLLVDNWRHSLRRALAGSGLDDELEHFEGVGVFGGGGCDTEGVSSGERDLEASVRSMGRTPAVHAYLVGREAGLTVNCHFEDGVGVLDLKDRGTTKVAVGVIAVTEG